MIIQQEGLVLRADGVQGMSGLGATTIALPDITGSPLLAIGALLVGGMVLGYILQPHVQKARRRAKQAATSPTSHALLFAAGGIALGYMVGKGYI